MLAFIAQPLSYIALALFPAMMAYAAASDLLTMRIANWLILALGVSFFVLAFFAFGWIGGGDAKLVAVTALWLGFSPLLPYIIYAALLGGGLTLMILALRRYPLPAAIARVGWIDRLHDNNSGVPYGIALAIAGVLVYPDTAIFGHFIGG
jgi:prepilin peptidase CpaA